MLASPISEIAKTITRAREYGQNPTTIKMNSKTLEDLFASDEGHDIASAFAPPYAPTIKTLSKAISGMVKQKIRVIIEPTAAPDKVYIG